MTTVWLVILAAVSAMVPVRTQSPQPDPAPVLAAMKAVAFLEGRWAGEGWIQMGSVLKEEFSLQVLFLSRWATTLTSSAGHFALDGFRLAGAAYRTLNG